MSTNYKSSKDVPLDVIVARLDELSGAIIDGRDAQSREFTMRIPAECDRDADLVISEAVNRINALQAQVSELRNLCERLQHCAQGFYLDQGDYGHMEAIMIDYHGIMRASGGRNEAGKAGGDL